MSDIQYAVRVNGKFVERFTYPGSIVKPEKAWEKSEGVKIAPCCKAIFGDVPFLWGRQDGARYVAKQLGGVVCALVDGREVRGRRRATR